MKVLSMLFSCLFLVSCVHVDVEVDALDKLNDAVEDITDCDHITIHTGFDDDFYDDDE